MNEIQNALFQMMQEIHKLCAVNGLKYYMVGGTMLGAMRHKGFIPWDDDMDISMPREDYNQFISLPRGTLPEWMEIKCPLENTINLGYSKVMNKNTTLVESFMKEKVGGVFIDVFPLDGIENNYHKAVRRMKIAQFLAFLLRANQGMSNLNCIAKKIGGHIAPLIKKELIFDLLEKYSRKHNYSESEYVANIVGAYSIKELTKKEYFGTPKLYKFETSEFYGVEHPAEFLSGLYGDAYMQIPPEDKRVSRHGITYMNLDMPYRKYINRRLES